MSDARIDVRKSAPAASANDVIAGTISTAAMKLSACSAWNSSKPIHCIAFPAAMKSGKPGGCG